MTSFEDVLCPFSGPQSRDAHYARYSQSAGWFICSCCDLDVPASEVIAMVGREVGKAVETRPGLVEIDPRAAKAVTVVMRKALAHELSVAELATIVLGWAGSQYPSVAVPYLRRTIAQVLEQSASVANRSAA